MTKLDKLGYFTNALLTVIILGSAFFYRAQVSFDMLILISFPGFLSLYRIIRSLATTQETEK